MFNTEMEFYNRTPCLAGYQVIIFRKSNKRVQFLRIFKINSKYILRFKSSCLINCLWQIFASEVVNMAISPRLVSDMFSSKSVATICGSSLKYLHVPKVRFFFSFFAYQLNVKFLMMWMTELDCSKIQHEREENRCLIGRERLN